MVIKVFLAGISASKEIKKRQQRALLILDSCKVDYESIDITEPGFEDQREFMQQNSKIREPNKTPLAPQFFNEVEYCGDYEDFDSAVEINQVLPFLKLEESNEEFVFNSDNHEKSTNGETNQTDQQKESSPAEDEEKQPPDNDDEGEQTKNSLTHDKTEDDEIEEQQEKDKDEKDKDKEEEETEEGDDDDFWTQDDNKKRKNDEPINEVEEVTERDTVDDVSKRLKINEDDVTEEPGKEDEEKEETEEKVEGDKEEVEAEKAEEDEEEEADFWASKD